MTLTGNFPSICIALALLIGSCIGDVEFTSLKLSSPRSSLSAVEAGERVFFVGGFEHGDQRATRTVEVYDLVAKNMTSPIFLDQPRAFVTPVVIEPNIYFVGGVEYQNRILIYDSDLHEVVDYGTGPTVVKAMQIEFDESLLVVLGVSGVDVLDVPNNTWIDTTLLTRHLDGLNNYALITHRGLVLILGGLDVATGVSSNAVWVYDVRTGALQEHPGVVPAPFNDTNIAHSMESDSVITVSLANNVDLLLFHAKRQEWRKEEFPSIYASYSIYNTTFLFNASHLVTIDWETGNSEIENFGTDFVYAFMLNDLVCYIKRAPDNAMEFYAYYPSTQSWTFRLVTYSTFNAVSRGVNLQNWHVFSTITGAVYGFNPEAKALYRVEDVDLQIQSVGALIPDEDPDAVRIFETAAPVFTKTIFMPEGISNTVKQAPAAIVPKVRLGQDFLTFQGQVMNVNSMSSVTNISLTMKSSLNAHNDKYMAFIEALQTSYDPARVLYKHVDVYNYVTDEWGNSTALPEELTQAYESEVRRSFYSAAAMDERLVIWMETVIAVYDPSTGLWSTYLNYTQGDVVNKDLSPVFKPVPVAQGLAYMRTDSNFFDVFSASSFETWNQTSVAPVIEDANVYVFHQSLVSNDNKIYVTGVTGSRSSVQFNTLYIYDTSTNTWEYQQLQNALNNVPIVALAGDYLLAVQNDGRLSYWDRINRFWYDQLLGFIFAPAVAIETSANVTIFAGGINQWGSWVDRIMVIPHTTISPNIPPVDNSPVVEPSSTGLTEGELVTAIVVPVGAALIAAALLAFFLVRRQKRRGGKSSTTIGLASRYGQWFIPYENIKFGAQIGQGASGQVFKGTWNNTTVALKVSMTQANSTVIGELELMMQLRPHPNVIQLFGFSVHPETESIILVIEFCNGGSLDDTLFDSTQQISFSQKISWLLGMAKGIEHLHANNIVHRDIAARNVLLNQNEPKITDFGMSRLLEEEKQHGTTKSELGPIRWMSPESLRNKEYSSKSDIWSFGVLMYEVIAQSEPHPDADPIEIGRLIRDNGKTPTIPPECPTELAQIMRECWHVTANKRISIDKIVLQLEAIQNTQQ